MQRRSKARQIQGEIIVMKTFILKLVPVLLLIPILCCYQTNAAARAEVVAAHDAEVEAAEELEAEYAAMLAEAQESPYEDGTYRGTGAGFGGDIIIELTIEDGKMSNIEIIDASGEDQAYMDEAVTMLSKVVKKQSTDVDTVSGATYSSNGILDAVEQAMGEALKE